MFTDFPSLHPLAVHFPVVLILIAFAFQAVVTWKLEWTQIRWATLLLMGAAFASALAASTLFHAMLSPSAPKSCWIVFNEHEKYAQYTLWMSGATLLIKAIGEFYKINKRSFEVLVLLVSLLSVVFLSLTGHAGARLTHIQGVGPMGRYLGTEEDEMNMENMGGMNGNSDNTDSTMNKMEMKDTANKNIPASNENVMPEMNMNNNNDKNNKNDKNNMGGMNMNNNKNNKNDKDNMGGMNMNNNDKNNKNDKDNMGGMNMNNNNDKNNMGGMNMPKKNAMDTIVLEDNNPVIKPKKKK